MSDTQGEQPWCVGCGRNKDAGELHVQDGEARCYSCLSRRDREAADRITFGSAPFLGDALARAQTALLYLAELYDLHGAEALARETRCIAEMMKARDSVLSGGGASSSAEPCSAPENGSESGPD